GAEWTGDAPGLEGGARPSPLYFLSMSRPRDRVLGNLESIYREAYERAKAAGDQTRMADLDAAYQREQLLLEVLLDIRDALASLSAPTEERPGGPGAPRRPGGKDRPDKNPAPDPLTALE